jgi:hypothetical protein
VKSMPRDYELDVAVGLALSALRDIALGHDCDYADAPERERLHPCSCAVCTAKRALVLLEGDWRYVGAHHGRLKTDPRERKIVAAWRESVGDRELGMILSHSDRDGFYENVEQPSPRDWYVATSVVQWLATNVGMEVLRGAGFRYEGFEEDRKERLGPAGAITGA